MRETDVLIVGAGLAGLNAAAEIQETHPELSVLLADAGGAASSEIMGFSAPVNPPDSAEVFFQDILRSGGGCSDPELAKILAERAVPEMRRLETEGILFDRTPDGRYDMVPALGSSFPRVVHHGTTTGKEAMKKRMRPVEKKRIVKLYTSDGAVCGAADGEGNFYRTGAVILTGGGFAGLWKFSTWSKNLRGDALVLAQDAGAELRDLGFIQFEPTVAVHPERFAGFPVITTILNEGAVLYDKHGDPLFEGPPPRKRELAERIQRAIDSGNALPHGGVGYDLSGVDEETFKRKYPEYHQKFGTTKNLLFEVKPGAHTTLGGIRVNGRCETAVTGLFAAGEAMGGLHGRDRLGGNAGLEVFVFGRIAGKNAAEYAARHHSKKNWIPTAPPENLFDLFPEEIRTVTDRYFTVTAGRSELEAGLRALDKLPETAHPTVRLIRQAFEDRIRMCGNPGGQTQGKR